MTIVTFLSKLFLDPVGFAGTYFKVGALQPVMRDKAEAVYALPSFLLFGGVYVGWVVNTVSLLVKMGAGLDVVGPMLVSFVLPLPFVYVGFWVVFYVQKWIFRSAMSWASFEVDKKRLDDLSLYLMAHAQVLLLPLLVLGVVLAPLFALGITLASQHLVMVSVVLFGGSVVGLWLRHQYVQYMLIAKWTDARFVEVLLAHWLLSGFLYVQVVRLPVICYNLFRYYHYTFDLFLLLQ